MVDGFYQGFVKDILQTWPARKCWPGYRGTKHGGLSGTGQFLADVLPVAALIVGRMPDRIQATSNADAQMDFRSQAKPQKVESQFFILGCR